MKRIVVYSMILLLFSVLLLSCPSAAQQAIRSGLSICRDAILPVLFPFFVVTELLISFGFTHCLEHIASPWMYALFHLPGTAASALILGTLGGYPIGAKTVAALYETKTLSKEHAQYCTLFMNNAGPGFIIGIAGNLLLHSARAGALLWLIHLTSSVVIGMLFRPPGQECVNQTIAKPQEVKVLPAISAAVGKSAETAIKVCAFVLFFSVLSSCLSMMFPQGCRTTSWFSVLTGVLELTAGITGLSSGPLSDEARFVAASFLLGWGGLCVHCQSISILNKSGLQAATYIAGKVLHAFVSLGLACLLAPILYVDSLSVLSIMLHAMPCFILLIIILFLPKTTSGKPSPNRI